MGVDVFDIFFKTADFIFFLRVKDEQEEYFAPFSTALAVALLVVVCTTVWRIREIREMRFVASHGYSLRWKKGGRALQDHFIFYLNCRHHINFK